MSARVDHQHLQVGAGAESVVDNLCDVLYEVIPSFPCPPTLPYMYILPVTLPNPQPLSPFDSPKQKGKNLMENDKKKSGFTAALFTDGEKCVANVINFPLVVLATNASNSGRYASPLATSVGMTTLEKGFVDHRGIVIGWEEKDLTSFSSTAKPTGSVSPAAAGEDSERRLPAGAIAGIVVGSVVWVAGMVGSIILWRRKRRRMAGSTGRHELQTDRTPEMFSPLGPPPPTGENKQLYGSPPVRRYELPVGSEGPAGDVYEMPSR